MRCRCFLMTKKTMKIKFIIKIFVDIIMTAVLLLLMAYSLVGETAHEWLGIGIFGLFVFHHALNVKWSKAMFKGKYTPYRIAQTAAVTLVLLAMCGSMISGVLLSRTVFTFLGDRVFLAQAQKLHMLCAYWGFVFLSLHLGLHWSNILNMANRLFKKNSSVRRWVVRIFGWVIAAYGIYAFFKRNFPGYMFLKIHFVYFDLSEPLIFYLADCLSVMGTFVCVGHYSGLILKRTGKSDDSLTKSID